MIGGSNSSVRQIHLPVFTGLVTLLICHPSTNFSDKANRFSAPALLRFTQMDFYHLVAQDGVVVSPHCSGKRLRKHRDDVVGGQILLMRSDDFQEDDHDVLKDRG